VGKISAGDATYDEERRKDSPEHLVSRKKEHIRPVRTDREGEEKNSDCLNSSHSKKEKRLNFIPSIIREEREDYKFRRKEAGEEREPASLLSSF